MRQSARALGWTVTVGIIIIVLFVGSAAYSMFQMLMTQGFGFGAMQTYPMDDQVVFSFSINVNNSGYYDISDINLTTSIRDFQGESITRDTTTIDLIKAGGAASTLEHNMSLSLGVLESLFYLLFEDGNFTLDTHIKMKYAYALTFQLNIMNSSFPWGAPFYNLSVGELPPLPFPPSSFNGTHFLIDIPLNFENHAFFDVSGDIRIQIFNDLGEDIGSGAGSVNTTQGSAYGGQIQVAIPSGNLSDITGKGYIEIYFESQAFSFGPLEVPYG